jgi:hypothetical protein
VEGARAGGGRKGPGLREEGSIGGNNKSLVESLAIVEDIEDTQSATGAKGGNGDQQRGWKMMKRTWKISVMSYFMSNRTALLYFMSNSDLNNLNNLQVSNSNSTQGH